MAKQYSDLPMGAYCPGATGGLWYVCGKDEFLGCCVMDPCTGTSCAAGNLRPASFDGTKHGTFADQECSAGSFYTCNGTNPPFLGCCKSNPCGKGCPSENLTAMILSNATENNKFFLPEGDKTSASLSRGAIAGITIGALIGVAALVGVIFFFWIRKRKTEQKPHSAEPEPDALGHYAPLPPKDPPKHTPKDTPTIEYSRKAVTSSQYPSPLDSPPLPQYGVSEYSPPQAAQAFVPSAPSPHASRFVPMYFDRESGTIMTQDLGISGINAQPELQPDLPPLQEMDSSGHAYPISELDAASSQPYSQTTPQPTSPQDISQTGQNKTFVDR